MEIMIFFWEVSKLTELLNSYNFWRESKSTWFRYIHTLNLYITDFEQI